MKFITTPLTRAEIADLAEYDDLATIPATSTEHVEEVWLVELRAADWTVDVLIQHINNDGTMELSFLDPIY